MENQDGSERSQDAETPPTQGASEGGRYLGPQTEPQEDEEPEEGQAQDEEAQDEEPEDGQAQDEEAQEGKTDAFKPWKPEKKPPPAIGPTPRQTRRARRYNPSPSKIVVGRVRRGRGGVGGRGRS